MKRELLIAVATTTLVAGMAGCSGGNKSSGPSSSATVSSGTASSATPGASGTETKVTVGGQVQPVNGPVVCATTDGKFSIEIGEVFTGVIVGLEPDGSVVHNAGLGTVNGVVMSFTEGAPGNNATAAKNGKAYHITGTATGTDDKNGNKLVSQPFTVDATCP
jgi:ipoprotein LpqH